MKAFITVTLVATLSLISMVRMADETSDADIWAAHASNEAEGKSSNAISLEID